MSDAALAGGLIGPNSILQLIEAIDHCAGPLMAGRVMALAGLGELPDGSAMIPEADAARLHRAVREAIPDLAPELTDAAGRGTADYILARRIPRAVQTALRCMPAAFSAVVLSRAIARHSWTFAGSGKFERLGAWRFRITANPLIAGEYGDQPLCRWHCAVFERLYRALVTPYVECHETRCGAQKGQDCCEFVVRPANRRRAKDKMVSGQCEPVSGGPSFRDPLLH